MVATRKWTVEELEANPPEGNWELVEGELVMMSPAGEESGAVAAAIAVLVGFHVRANRLGRSYGADTGFRPFAEIETVRAPDFAVVRGDRLAAIKDRERFLPLAPDLAVEVLSATDRRSAALSKCGWWLEVGTALVWLVDPERRAVTVFTPDEPPRTLAEGDTLDGGDVIPGLSIPVADIFA